MIKVSITLPNNAQITFETEDAGVIREVVGMVLRDLPRDLMELPFVGNGSAAPTLPREKGNDVPDAGAPDISAPAETLAPSPDMANQRPTIQEPLPPSLPAAPSDGASAPAGALPTVAERHFIDFCREADPNGDMRRVVVAAEGARRLLDRGSVDSESLEELFHLAGWPSAHNFVQTLRNAARTKFRWLERVPGRSGHYTVTDIGRAATGLLD